MSKVMATPDSVELAEMGVDGFIPKATDILKNLSEVRAQHPNLPLSQALPLVFRLKGRPYSIAEGHFLFEHEYATHNIPRRQIDVAGRQVSKSTNKAAGGILRAAAHDYFSLLTVTPLFEQVRKFSNNYVKPFLRESVLRTELLAKGSDQQVLQRTLSNGSTLFYNYATNSADRVRGTPADEVDCLRKGTPVYLADGSVVPVESLSRGDCVLSVVDGGISSNEVTRCVFQGYRPLWRITLDNEATLEVTDNEVIPTDHGWCSLADILAGATDSENPSRGQQSQHQEVHPPDRLVDDTGLRDFTFTLQGEVLVCRAEPRRAPTHNRVHRRLRDRINAIQARGLAGPCDDTLRLLWDAADTPQQPELGGQCGVWGHRLLTLAVSGAGSHTCDINGTSYDLQCQTSGVAKAETRSRPLCAVGIADIEYIGEDAVYDVCLARHHNFFAGHGSPILVSNCDELQDFDMTVLPVIQSCLDASPFKLERYSGTPKTFDNPIALYWNDSSQGIWHIPCQETGCKHVNICCVNGGDILNMIGDNTRRRDGSVRTLICSKCGGPLDSRLGFYVHSFADRRLTFAGRHMPQIVFPMHYGSALAWDKVLDVARNKPKYIFFNEVLGESYDTGQKLITIKDLSDAARGRFIKPSEIKQSDYVQTALGVDWGGKGKEKVSDADEFISNTCLALVGVTADSRIHVTWGYQTPYTADHYMEAQMVREAAMTAGVTWVAHDYGGAGDVRESILVKVGWPVQRLAPMNYVTAAPDRNIVTPNAGSNDGSRLYWGLDKGRSLLLLCELIRAGWVTFAPYEGLMKSLMDDFLNIFEERSENPRGRGLRLVRKVSRQHDDFVHAVNFAVMTLYYSTQLWPNVADAWMTLNASDLVSSDGTAEGSRLWLPSDLL